MTEYRLQLDYAFRIVNVFTIDGDRFSGNPLAVFDDAGHGAWRDEADITQRGQVLSSPLETQVEAYAYLGERLAADGNPKRAADYWRRAVDLGVHEFIEHHLARQRLATAR